MLASLDRQRPELQRDGERAVVQALLVQTTWRAATTRRALRTMGLRSGRGRCLGNPARWAALRDGAADLALFLSSRLDGTWRTGGGLEGRRAARPFKQAALEDAARARPPRPKPARPFVSGITD